MRTRRLSDTVGHGHIYQGRYHSSLVETDLRFVRTIRYVEANPVRSGLVARAELWHWSSLSERLRSLQTLDAGPFELPADEEWLALVNATALASPKPPRRRSRTPLACVR